MVLGDNIYFGEGFSNTLMNARLEAQKDMATIFGFQVKDPNRFGIMELDDNNNVLSVEEKPEFPKSDYAITGLYFYPKGVADMAKEVKPSKRNELEITSLNDMYLQEGRLRAELLGDGYYWFDTGTTESLYDAASVIRGAQRNQGKIVACPEVIAYQNDWITDEQLEQAAELMKKNEYGHYLSRVLKKGKR